MIFQALPVASFSKVSFEAFRNIAPSPFSGRIAQKDHDFVA